MWLFHCLWSSIVSLHYRYQVWQGSDCVLGTCVPSKTNTWAGFDLLDDFQSSCCSGGLWEGRWWKGWQSDPSLLQLWSFIFLASEQINLELHFLSTRHARELMSYIDQSIYIFYIFEKMLPIDIHKHTPFLTLRLFLAIFRYWRGLMKRDGAVFCYLLLSSPSPIPQ